jgi:thymidylate synthase (FAD)
MANVTLIAKTVLTDDLTRFGLSIEEGVTDMDRLPEYGGRNCYLSEDRPNPKTRTNRGYLGSIQYKKHFSVFSHAAATFVVECTRATSHEIARHIFLGKSEVSQRYCDPKKILDRLDVGFFDETEHNYAMLAAERAFNAHVAEGATLKHARGRARMHLPMGFPTRIVLSGNVRAWRDFLWQRLSPTADEEIREVAERILDELELISPSSVQDLTRYRSNGYVED